MRYVWQARRDSNPHHPDLESGALSVRATGLAHLSNTYLEDCKDLKNLQHQRLLGLFMRRVHMTKSAVLLELKLTGCLFLILRRIVVPVLALRTGQYHNVSHPSATLYTKYVKKRIDRLAAVSMPIVILLHH